MDWFCKLAYIQREEFELAGRWNDVISAECLPCECCPSPCWSVGNTELWMAVGQPLLQGVLLGRIPVVATQDGPVGPSTSTSVVATRDRLGEMTGDPLEAVRAG